MIKSNIRIVNKIAKQNIVYFDSSEKYKKQIKIFNSTNFRDRAVYEIRNNRNRVGAINNVIKTRFIDWRDWILLVLCFIPFSNILLSYLFMRKSQII